MKRNDIFDFEIDLRKKVPVLNPELRIAEVLHLLKHSSVKNKEIIYCVDENGMFRGISRLDVLLSASPGHLLHFYTQYDYPRVPSDISEEKAANIALGKKATTLPVVDKEGKLINVISTETIFRILRKEHIEDLHKMAGIQKESSLAKEALESPPLRRARHRLPWLIAGLAGSIFATGIMSEFESTLEQNIQVSFFIPGIVYLADAIGTQTEAISVRGLSLSDISFKDHFFREMSTGMVIGGVLAVLSIIPISIFYNLTMGLIVGLSVWISGTIASSSGLLFPWILSRLKTDPAFGSGPIATIIQDILSILVYFIIVTLFNQ